MKKLIKGISEFQKSTFPNNREFFQELANQQDPEVMFLTCCDSRVDPSLITETDPGDLFIHRNVGNIVPPHSLATGGVTASIEFAVSVLGVQHIIVCGHTDCGAMKGAMQPDIAKSLPHVHNWLSHSAAALARVSARHDELSVDEHLHEMTEENVLLQLRHLETHPSVATSMAKGNLELHGWVYDIGTGGVNCFDPNQGKFVSVQDRYAHLHTTDWKETKPDRRF